jgi:hypothetical protein
MERSRGTATIAAMGAKSAGASRDECDLPGSLNLTIRMGTGRTCQVTAREDVRGRLRAGLGSESAGVIVDAQDRHFWRGGQDFAERMHPLAGILAAELIELVEILHLDLELQGRPAVAAG